MANLQQAVELCRIIETFCPIFGCHVGMTGGCLYKDGERKDIDILFYGIRQIGRIDREGLTVALEAHGITLLPAYVYEWMQKMRWRDIEVDVLFPDMPTSGTSDYGSGARVISLRVSDDKRAAILMRLAAHLGG